MYNISANAPPSSGANSGSKMLRLLQSIHRKPQNFHSGYDDLGGSLSGGKTCFGGLNSEKYRIGNTMVLLYCKGHLETQEYPKIFSDYNAFC